MQDGVDSPTEGSDFTGTVSGGGAKNLSAAVADKLMLTRVQASMNLLQNSA